MWFVGVTNREGRVSLLSLLDAAEQQRHFGRQIELR
jgi:hypothetical protein